MNRPSREELYRIYIEEDHSQKETAAIFGVCYATMNKWLKEYAIKKVLTKRPAASTLRKMNRKRRMTAEDIAREYNVSTRTVYGWFKKVGLPMKSGARLLHPTPPDDELYRLYITENLSQAEMARYYGASENYISWWLRDAGIRKAAGKRSKKPERGILYDLYIKQGYSTIDISRIYGVGSFTVSKWLKKDGIQTRNPIRRKLE